MAKSKYKGLLKKKKTSIIDNLPKTEEEHLLLLIKRTEEAITDQNTGIDEFFCHQADRLHKELAELRKKNK